MNKKIIFIVVTSIVLLGVFFAAYYFLWRPDLIITNVKMVNSERCIYEYEVQNVGFVSIKNAFIENGVDYCSLVADKKECKFWSVVGHNPETGASLSVTLKPGEKYKTLIYLGTYNNKCPDQFNMCVDCGTRIYYEKEVTINDVKEISEKNNDYKYQAK